MSVKKLNNFIDSFSYYSMTIYKRQKWEFTNEVKFSIYNQNKDVIYQCHSNIMNTNCNLNVDGSYIQRENVDLSLSMDAESKIFIEEMVPSIIDQLIENEVRKEWSEDFYYSGEGNSIKGDLKPLTEDLKALLKR